MCWHMKYEMYKELLVLSDYLVYEFNSIGPKGSIPKIIEFTRSEYDDIFNLGFGTKKEDGGFDDFARDKIMIEIKSLQQLRSHYAYSLTTTLINAYTLQEAPVNEQGFTEWR
jgi:hypothetical protein